MKHKVRLTVIDKKLYPELQQQYCADPNSGACPCYNAVSYTHLLGTGCIPVCAECYSVSDSVCRSVRRHCTGHNKRTYY